jgi:hypothetical protein
MRTNREAAALASLRHVSEVEPLADKDRPLVDDLIRVLKKHNALDRFGITLLHKHFEMTEDEMLLETTDLATRIQTIQPVKKSELEGLDAIVTAWRLDTEGPLMNCKCIKTGKDHEHHSRGYTVPEPGDDLERAARAL